LMIALINYMFIGMSPLVQGVEPSIIVLRIAMGFIFIIGLYVAIRLRLYAPACVLENNFGLKTSWKLVKGNWWRLFTIVLIFGVMSAIISQIPLIGSFLSGLIVDPFTITAMTLVYFRLREAESSGEERKESL
jgi:membrane-anchored glycerophosphoryl diester phosphodiesterase (GDPDase)